METKSRRESSASFEYEQHELVMPRFAPLTQPLRHLASCLSYKMGLSEYIQHDRRNNPASMARSCVVVASECLYTSLPRFPGTRGHQKAKKLHPTSFLDALRGIAAVVVLNSHHFPYQNAELMQLPFIRVLKSGRGMVDVFFVISGYALSYRMLKLVRTRQPGPILDSLASSCFRRYMRLYLSAALASFTSMILHRLRWAAVAPRTDTFAQQLADWAADQARFSNPFVALQGFWAPGVHSSKYLDVLWTIPVEFRGSLLLFFFAAASCKLSTRARMLFCWALILACYYWAESYPALFLGGFFLADLSLSLHPERLYPLLHTNLAASAEDQAALPAPKLSLKMKIVYISIFLAALILLGLSTERRGGNPFEAEGATPESLPLYVKLIPSSFLVDGRWEHFYLSIGAFMLVLALDSYPTLQKPLNHSFSQYLGYVSFGIYVMHMLVVWSLWQLVLDPLRAAWLGNAAWTYAPCLILNYMAVFWAADLFSRVDGKVVNLGRAIEKRVFEW